MRLFPNRPLPEPISLQALIDLAIPQIRARGYTRATDEFGTCAHRGQGGLPCLIGMALDDDLARKLDSLGQASGGIAHLLDKDDEHEGRVRVEELVARFEGIALPDLVAFQRLHDCATLLDSNKEQMDPKLFEEALFDYCNERGLTYPPIQEAQDAEV